MFKEAGCFWRHQPNPARPFWAGWEACHRAVSQPKNMKHLFLVFGLQWIKMAPPGPTLLNFSLQGAEVFPWEDLVEVLGCWLTGNWDYEGDGTVSPAPIQVNDNQICSTRQGWSTFSYRQMCSTPAHVVIQYLWSQAFDCKVRTPRVIQRHRQENICLCGTSPWAVAKAWHYFPPLNKSCSVLCFCVFDGVAPSPINLQHGIENK